PPTGSTLFPYTPLFRSWGHGGLALMYESWWKTRQLREWRLAPDGDAAPVLLREASYEDRYADPGSAVMQSDERGFARLLTAGDGDRKSTRLNSSHVKIS